MNGKNLFVLVLLMIYGSYVFSFTPIQNKPPYIQVAKYQNHKMTIKIGAKVFTASLLDNEASKAFIAMLPLTIKMQDLNGNEKKYDFPKRLPTHSVAVTTIKTGDLMLWTGNTLVLFYKSFDTNYSYTKLGHIDDSSGLAAALGSGNVTVTYALGN